MLSKTGSAFPVCRYPPQSWRDITLLPAAHDPLLSSLYVHASTMLPGAPAPIASSFLSLPTEIRLQIYSLLLLPHTLKDLEPSDDKIASCVQDSRDYYINYYERQGHPVAVDHVLPPLRFRTIRPAHYNDAYLQGHRRTKYSVCADRFRAACLETTYRCTNFPRTGEEAAGLLRCNRRINAEVTELLYGSFTFDFDTHIEAVVPFLADLTPFARSCIKSVRVVKRALAYLRDYDRCEWRNAMRYLSSEDNDIRLKRLELGVVAGMPGRHGWEGVETYSAADLEQLQGLGQLEWVPHLLALAGLQELEVEAVIEHCPPASTSSAMADYVRFSASVSDGFAKFLKCHMLEGKLSEGCDAVDCR